MVNLDNLTFNFIELNYLDLEKPLLYDAFSLMESFGLQYYEDRYIELVAQSDNYHKEDLLTIFNRYLTEDLGNIIKQHYITLNKEDMILKEYIEFTRFLFIIQSMQDYENVSYRLYSNDTPRNIMIDLIADITPVSKFRIMELVDSVEEHIISSLRQLVEDKIESSMPDHVLDPLVVKFTKYIGDNAAIGNILINKLINVGELKDLDLILDLDLQDHIDKHMPSNTAQAALDVLSLLLVCTDSRKDPLGAFKAHPEMFSDNNENIRKIEPILSKMWQDFKDYADHTPA